MFLFVSRAPYAAKQLFTTNTFPKDMYLLEHLLVQSLSSQQWLPAQVLYMRTMHTPQELHGSIWLTLHIKSQTLSIDKLSGGQTTKSLSIDQLLVVGGTFFLSIEKLFCLNNKYLLSIDKLLDFDLPDSLSIDKPVVSGICNVWITIENYFRPSWLKVYMS